MNNYQLFLDDERTPHQITWVDIPLFGWEIVRTYKDFVETIQKNGLPIFISFDHDLGLNDSSNEKNGYHCAQWLINYCLDNNLDFPEYRVHSQNPVGRENIQCLINNYNNFNKDNKSVK